MAIQSFSVGQVLTAAQVNALQANDYNQTVNAKTASYTLVAADKGTRITMSSTSATTITVNTSLFSAGDTLFIQNLNTGVTTITAGTATVTTASSLALAQWEGGTLYFTSTSAAIFIKGAGAAAGGGGKVLQVVQATSSTQISKANDTYSDAMSVSITPTLNTSTILLMFSGNFYMNGANTLARGRFTRGGTTILDYNGFQFNATGSGDEFAWNPYCTYIDSPATTSSITYAFQFNRQVADSGSVIFNYQQGGLTQLGVFIAMEIGA